MDYPNAFTLDVIEKLACYVYRLVDPRNGETFYVGKGRGNRIFDHVLNIGNSDESVMDPKQSRINAINNEGLSCVLIIHRHGLEESVALEVEAALIDAYIDLTNKQAGSGSNEYGIQNVKQIQVMYGASEIPEEEFNKHKIMLIKINKSLEEGLSIYDATRFSWKAKIENAQKADYVLSVKNGVIKAIYRVDKWIEANQINFPGFSTYDEKRIGFVGNAVDDKNIIDIYLNKRIPASYMKKGASNPVMYNYEN